MIISRFNDGQIVAILIEVDAGATVPTLCRTHGTSSETFRKWRVKLGGMDASLRRSVASRLVCGEPAPTAESRRPPRRYIPVVCQTFSTVLLVSRMIHSRLFSSPTRGSATQRVGPTRRSNTGRSGQSSPVCVSRSARYRAEMESHWIVVPPYRTLSAGSKGRFESARSESNPSSVRDTTARKKLMKSTLSCAGASAQPEIGSRTSLVRYLGDGEERPAPTLADMTNAKTTME